MSHILAFRDSWGRNRKVVWNHSQLQVLLSKLTSMNSLLTRPSCSSWWDLSWHMGDRRQQQSNSLLYTKSHYTKTAQRLQAQRSGLGNWQSALCRTWPLAYAQPWCPLSPSPLKITHQQLYLLCVNSACLRCFESTYRYGRLGSGF